MPQFICSNLNYSMCANLHAQARNKEKGKPIAKNGAYHIQRGTERHPVTRKPEECYWLRMYDTDILVFFADGAVRINDYNSPTTTAVLRELGPVHVFNDSHTKFSNKRRFGRYGASYPMPSTLDVSADGIVQNKLVDFTRKVRPECKAERRQIRKALKEAAFARLSLGEFPQLIEPHSFQPYYPADAPPIVGFRAYTPLARSRMFELLIKGANHEEIAEVVERGSVPLKMQKYGPGFHHYSGNIYPNQAAAASAIINCLVELALFDDRYFVDVTTEYKKGEVRAW